MAEPAKRAASVQTNGQLLRRMVRFVLPVKGIATLAGVLVIVWMVVEVLFTRMTGNVANAIQSLEEAGKSTGRGGGGTPENFSRAMSHDPLRSILYMILILGLLVILNAGVRFAREFVNSKFTMDMVFHMARRCMTVCSGLDLAFTMSIPAAR